MLRPFFVRHNKELRRVHPEDVMCLYTEGNYTKIYLKDKNYYMVRSTLSGAMKKLPPEIFIKINRSFIASVYYIDKINRDHLLVNGFPAPIAKQYYRNLMERLNVIE